MIANRLAMPIKICGKQVQNRIIVPPISDFGVVSPTGKVTVLHIKR